MTSARTAGWGVAAAAVVGAMAVLGLAGSAPAQTQVFGRNLEGEIEAGGRLFAEEPSKSRSAKFEEYRDFPEGLFLEKLRLRYFTPDEGYSAELEGSKWGQQDQELSLRAGRLGLWEFEFDWDQTLHVFSTNAKTLLTETARGVLTLPTPRPARALFNTSPELDQIGVRWDTARLSFRLTPTPDLELKAEYTRINKDGDRPFGVPFGFNFIEALEPIEQTIHDLRLGGTIARESWQLQVGYTLSIFQNELDRLRVDNPFATTTGQMSLPPDNLAHTFSLASGVNLPWWRTRLTGNFSYSLRLQNEDFLPHTINPDIPTTEALALHRHSLNGNVQVFLVNLNATSRPLPPLTLSMKYRLYDYHDESNQITFPSIVETDTNQQDVPHRSGQWSYRRQSADADARWRILQPVAFTLGAGWERWDRNERREVPTSDELFGKAVLDVTPLDWLLIQAKYVPSFRRTDHYIGVAPLAQELQLQDAATQTQLFLLRKFDEAERNRQRVDVMLQATPLETLTATPTFSYRFDDYLASRMGLQEERSWSAGMDVNWSPVERFSIFGGYVHERIENQMRSRFRPVVLNAIQDFNDFDFVSRNIDTVETYHAGISATLIPRVLDWTLGGNYSTALGRIKTFNPLVPTSGTAGQRFAATARTMPAFEDTLLRLETALKYHFWKNWTAKLSYVFESFEQNDWRTDGLEPFRPEIGNAVWLGSDVRDYTAQMVLITLGYRFK